MSDYIHLKEMVLATVLGVPDDERAHPQSVSVNASLALVDSISGMADELAETVNYFAIYQALKATAARGERKLLETLSEDLAATILDFEGIASVHLEVEKFILPNCGAVSVEISRSKS